MKKYLPFFILVLSFTCAPLAHAQVSLVVSPPRIEIEAKPGEIIQKTIKVSNPSDSTTLSLKTLVKDFIVQDDLGTPIPVETIKAGKYLASPWFTLDQSTLSLAPQEQVSLIVIISIPSDALPGGHYSGVFFEPVPQKGLKDTVSYTSAQVGTLVSVTVAGNIKYDAIIKSFTSDQTIYEFGPVNFSATLENQSDTHITPSGKITIKNMLGKTLTELPLDQVNIFPYTSRSWNIEWDQVWGFGKYSAELSFSYGPGGQVVNRLSEFWILPYRLLLAIAVILLALIGILVSLRRHLKHQHDSRDQEIDELKRRIVELENTKR